MSIIRQARAENNLRFEMFYDSVAIRGVSGAMGNSKSSIAAIFGSGDDKTMRLYSHNRGLVNTAIRPIADRIGMQPIVLARKKRGSVDQARFIFGNPGRVKLRTMTHKERKQMPQVVRAYHSEFDYVESHPLLEALQKPNNDMTTFGLLNCTIYSLCLIGCAYWFFDYNKDGKLEIWPIPKHWLTPDGKGGFAMRPENYLGDPIPIPKENLAVFQFPNPANPTAPFSPVAAQLMAVETDDSIQRSQNESFKRGIFPGILLTTGRLPGANGNPGQRPVLTGAQRQQIFQAVSASWEGVANFREPLILDGLIEDAKPFTSKPMEMDFTESGKSTKNRIFQGIGTNPSIVGETEGSNRAQATVAEQSFLDNAVNPKTVLISQVLTETLGRFVEPDGSLVVYIETCYARDREQTLREYNGAARAGACTGNEYRTEVLGLAPIKGADVILRPLNMVAYDPKTGEKLPGQDDESSDPKTDEEKPADAGESEEEKAMRRHVPRLTYKSSKVHKRDYSAIRELAYNAFEKQWQQFQADYNRDLHRYFREQYIAAADIFAAYEGTGITPDLADRVYDPEQHKAELMDITRPVLIKALVESAATQLALAKINDVKNIDPNEVQVSLPPELLTRLGIILDEIMRKDYWSHVVAETREDIRGVIERGLREGWSHGQIERELRGHLAGPRAAARAENIARTETGSAMNGGHMAGIEELERQGLATGKEWLNPCSNTSRKHHCKLTGVRRKVNENFDLGGESTPYPMWHGLSAQNRCNCLCTVLSVTLADGDLSQGLPGGPVEV